MAPNCSSNNPDLPNIRFDGSRTNGIAVAAQNAPAARVPKLANIRP